MLERIKSPHDVSLLKFDELSLLADEIRGIIIDSVIKNGGHLASNLGVVELTLALNFVFNQDYDKILFDVGHQCYTHKILTGRAEKMLNSLRSAGGISGFPNIEESKYDLFTVGHSGSSISQAAGLAKARDLSGESFDVISVIGDASLTTGLSFEAMNNATQCKQIIVLNDNNMSISKNVGSVSRALTGLRENNLYKKLKKSFIKFAASETAKENDFEKLSLIKRLKNGLKYSFMDGVLFEEFGLKYIGPVDGHNIPELINYLNIAKEEEVSVLVHVVTKKGKGCIEAEDYPNLYHGVDSPKRKPLTEPCFSEVFGNTLTEIAKSNERIIAICPAMTENTGLIPFKKKYPDRFVDVGIAEEHAITLSAGIAKGGYKPFVAIFSSFLQRGFDQVTEDIALQKLPVTICVDRAGIVGEDGETHHGIFDLSVLSALPNVSIVSPATTGALKQMLNFAVEYGKPLIIRYSKGRGASISADFKFGKWKIIKGDISCNSFLLSHGATEICECLLAAENLNDVAVVDCSTIKPLDEEFLLSISKKKIYVIEDNIGSGGLGENVLRYYNTKKLAVNVTLRNISEFVKHGKSEDLLAQHGLDAKSICKIVAE